jgi:hypothetical protein
MSKTFHSYSRGSQEEKLFLNRTEMAALCRVSLSTLARGVRTHKWPFCAFIRLGKRMVYPVSLIDEMEAKAKVHAGLEREVKK